MQHLVIHAVLLQKYRMKKLVFMGGMVLMMASCNMEPETKDDCIHCTGCFSSWDECESTYTPGNEETTSWEEHRNYMVNNPDGGTWHCERNNE